MKTYTKKQLNNDLQKMNNWYIAKLFKNNGKWELFIGINGGSILESIYNNTVDTIDVEDIYIDYMNEEYGKAQAVDFLVERIKEFEGDK